MYINRRMDKKIDYFHTVSTPSYTIDRNELLIQYNKE